MCNFCWESVVWCACVQQEKQNEALYLREHRGELVEELAKTIVEKVRNAWIAIWLSGRCAELGWFWWHAKIQHLLPYLNLLGGALGWRSSGCKPQLCSSQIINRKKTLADMREEYDQELLSERRTDHQLVCDEASPKQNLWVKDIVSVRFTTPVIATVILEHPHLRVHSKWKLLISRQKTETDIFNRACFSNFF